MMSTDSSLGEIQFHYSFITSHGNVGISHTPENWYRVSFHHRCPNEGFVEVLGTYRSVAEAVGAASNGICEEPNLDVKLADLEVSPDLFNWTRHYAGVAS